jgi:hypothetical protein
MRRLMVKLWEGVVMAYFNVQNQPLLNELRIMSNNFRTACLLAKI